MFLVGFIFCISFFESFFSDEMEFVIFVWLKRMFRLEFDTCDQFHQGRPAEKELKA